MADRHLMELLEANCEAVEALVKAIKASECRIEVLERLCLRQEEEILNLVREVRSVRYLC